MKKQEKGKKVQEAEWPDNARKDNQRLTNGLKKNGKEGKNYLANLKRIEGIQAGW